MPALGGKFLVDGAAEHDDPVRGLHVVPLLGKARFERPDQKGAERQEAHDDQQKGGDEAEPSAEPPISREAEERANERTEDDEMRGREKKLEDF